MAADASLKYLLGSLLGTVCRVLIIACTFGSTGPSAAQVRTQLGVPPAPSLSPDVASASAQALESAAIPARSASALASASAPVAEAAPVTRAELTPLLPFTGEVVEVTNAAQPARRQFSLSDTFIVQLKSGGVSTLQARAKVKNEEIGLVLDGHYLKGLAARRDGADPDRLLFDVRFTDEDKEAWSSLFRKRQRLHEGMTVTVGFPDGEMARSTVKIRLLIIPPWQSVLAGLLAAGVLGLVIFLGARTPMLRSPRPGATSTGALGPYNLGLVQMASWTVVVICSFLFLYLITGAVQLNSSVVVLMGIGAATALGATLINQSKPPPEPSPLVPGAASALSRGLLQDLMMDDSGISLHRLQMFAWTVILSAIFIHSVLTALTMADFDSTLLAMMGISSGTYLGFKIPEKQGLS